ncbi:MAG: aldehyde dehydrogenase family protein [Phycisphaerales bacterium]|nr:aldehyde dehydrogenase family protein [Phycisphaerales bacterium]
MPDRLDVTKTYKLFIDGKFPRSESGRTIAVAKGEAHVCRASRKDLRDAVTAARKALPGWKNASAYLRGQILYRMAEMLEGKREEFAALLAGSGRKSKGTPDQVAAAIDRVIGFAGWADKYAQVLGCNNPVVGPFYNFTTPEATGVVGVIAPDEPALLGLLSLALPAICAGNTVVVLAGETDAAMLCSAVLAEVIATSDVPGGTMNILTGQREELIPIFAGHRDIDAIVAAGLSDDHARLLREGAAENVKRVSIDAKPNFYDDQAMLSPWRIEPVVEMKTIWHPSGT